MGCVRHIKGKSRRAIKGEEEEASQPVKRPRVKWKITTKRNLSNAAYLLQLLQGRCIDASFLEVYNTGVDNVLNDALVNFTLFFDHYPNHESHTCQRAPEMEARGAYTKDDKDIKEEGEGETLTTRWFDISSNLGE